MKSDDMPEVIFLLGAGASIPCGVPGMKGLMSQFDKEIINDETRKLMKELKQPEDIGLEEFIERLDILANLDGQDKEIFYSVIYAGDETRKNLNIISKIEEDLLDFVYAECLNFNRKNAEQFYLGLLGLREKYGWKPMHIFSLNYDTCIEDTCRRNKIEYDCGLGEENKKAEIYLYKLHGSVSWYRDTPEGGIKEISWRGDRVIKIGDKKIRPRMIYPVIGINELLLDPFLELMNSFKKKLLDAELCISIGYRFADHHIKGLLEKAATENGKLILVLISPHATSLAEKVFFDSELKIFPYEGSMTDINKIVDTLLSERNLSGLREGFNYVSKADETIDIEKKSRYLRDAISAFKKINDQYNIIKYCVQCISRCDKTGNARALGDTCLILADLLKKRNRMDLSDYYYYMAREFYIRCLELYKGKKSITFLLNLIEASMKSGFLEESIRYLILARDISEKRNATKKKSQIERKIQEIRDFIEIARLKREKIEKELVESGEIKQRSKIGYLFLVKDYRICYEIFGSELTGYSKGLYITLHFPEALERRYKIESADSVWLGNYELNKIISIGDTLERIEKQMRCNKYEILFFDSLKYVFDSFESEQDAWDFFFVLMEIAQSYNAIIWLLADPKDFDLRGIHILSQYLEVISEKI